MKVKGSVVSSIDRFVKDNFPDQHKAWKNNLPEKSQQIYNDIIGASEWYDMKYGVLDPTKLIGDLFYDHNVKKAAWEAGYYSATVALTGIYKVFVYISTPAFMMARAGKILASFYDQAVIKVVDNHTKNLTLHITEFPDANDIIDYRIAGWMEKALEICGCRDIQINITKMLAKGDEVTEFVLEWQ